MITLKKRKRGDAESLGERLRSRRRELSLTQEQLAERADTTQAVIQKIENGKSLRPRKIDKIALALDVKAAWLMFGNDRFDELDREAAQIAAAWSRLDESARASLRREILRQAG
ncbi:MAG: helix-turn-helix transcriptional regulator [Pseudomonadota bacterium]